MELFEQSVLSIRDFFEAGGNVLWAILAVTTLMWTLIIERLWYFRTGLRRQVRAVQQEWDARQDTTSWYAKRVREELISRVALAARRHLLMIRALMVMLPLLGLLGTVTGMISVFDVMAVLGTGNARLMADGVYQATIPTMAGLVAALSGLYLATWLEQRAESEVQCVADALVYH